MVQNFHIFSLYSFTEIFLFYLFVGGNIPPVSTYGYVPVRLDNIEIHKLVDFLKKYQIALWREYPVLFW